MTSPRIIFRCDASPAIGGGHVVRCMALAAAFQEHGAVVRFCVSDDTPTTVRELTSELPDALTGFTGDISEVERFNTIFGTPADVIVIDHYGIDLDYEVRARDFTHSLLVIDDFPNRRHVATHIVDTTYGRHPSEYSAIVGKDAILMCGSAYALLRPAFRALRKAAGGPTNPSRLNVLVTFGMTDPANISSMTASALADLAGHISVTFVIGGKAPHLDQLCRTLAAGAANWRLVLDADAERMASLTAKADLVIGAPGSASYERCCLGKPTLLVQVADNQAGNAASLVAAGAAQLIGIVPNVRHKDIRDAVAALLAAPDKIRRMSASAFGITDGKGVERVAAMVLGRRVAP